MSGSHHARVPYLQMDMLAESFPPTPPTPHHTHTLTAPVYSGLHTAWRLMGHQAVHWSQLSLGGYLLFISLGQAITCAFCWGFHSLKRPPCTVLKALNVTRGCSEPGGENRG